MFHCSLTVVLLCCEGPPFTIVHVTTAIPATSFHDNNTTMSLPTTIALNDGHRMPVVGFGTFQSKPDEVGQAVATALEAGYRHIDCASIYGNEKEVGQAIRSSGIAREEIFITSKLWNNNHHPDDVEAALDATLADLGLNYVDLYLIHWPV